MQKFSLYYSDRGIKQVTPTSAIDLRECAEIIRTDPYLIEKTSLLRKILDKDERSKFKAGLPYVTFSGTFKTRANNKLIERSEYFCCDLDDIGNIDEIQDVGRSICQYFTPALMFISPRGNGLKTVFKIDISAGSHLDFYNAFELFFKTELGQVIDKQCKDIARACFLCHDPEVFFAKEPSILSYDFIYNLIVPVTVEIPAMNEADRFDAAKKWTDSRLNFTQGHRNHYVYVLADTCNRYGINEAYALSRMTEFSENGFSMAEIEAIVKSRYLHTEWHGIANSGTTPPDKNPYTRVGTTYYKIIEKTDRYGLIGKELKVWNKDALIQDYGRKFVKTIPKYDDFIMYPDNLNFKSHIDNCYNLYSKFRHEPNPGLWTWTERLLKHVFGLQYELGLRYMQILYLHPDKSTIILVLVSQERGTGKTTFVNWINILFGANVALLSSGDFQSSFNASFATKNIIVIEETLLERQITIEKLKALATSKYMQINEKYVVPYKIPFYGKIILTSNNEDRFASVDQEEIRFFVRKLGQPEFINHDIETNLQNEIPAFLDYLKTLPPVDWSVSRSGFTPEELDNEFLAAVKAESQHQISKELRLLLADYFSNHDKLIEFYASPIDLKKQFFADDYRSGVYWLMRALKYDFKMLPAQNQRYYPFNEELTPSKVGRPYLFKRSVFVTNVEDVIDENPPY